ncbi:inositol polyphosphate 5-phosphatase [Lunasporangiospora selenospora]|uniref:phosphoinositide 5-phosphatase n=1 Tax=Lunasporangiospora selenospora TaxID=979761 RepID=A0A9P6FVX0_9FUNG|nr:inositol polyphosphate 5-phosphatase [Lunasporangiospora selenospora]
MMQCDVYLSQGQSGARSIILRPATNRLGTAADKGATVHFSLHPDPTPKRLPQVSVQLEPTSAFDSQQCRKLYNRPVYGCLGLMHLAGDTFIALVTGCTKVGEVRVDEHIYRIIAVKFFSLSGNTPDEDMIPSSYSAEYSSGYESDSSPPAMVPHPCRELEKVLCNGAFFFSPHFDLTRSIQARTKRSRETLTMDANAEYDESFLWNAFMLKELLAFRSHLEEQQRAEFDYSGLLYTHPVNNVNLLGTRYNTRGIDDSGNVANFVETETILSNRDWCFAYTQIRGSVPVFWEQQGLQLASHKIQLSRSSEAARPAVRRHFEELIQKYESVHILDLLGSKDSGEVTLTQEYRAQVLSIDQSIRKDLHMTCFDYHSYVKGGNYDQVRQLLDKVRGDSERFGYFYHDLHTDSIIESQRGVFRTNCLDCLDRTNVIQSSLSKEVVEALLHNLLPQDSRFANLMLVHSEIWADNGDMLSKIYTGTGALKSDVTRSGKMSFASMLGDATKSINRFYINNFQDKDRQEVIDILLGKMSNQAPVAIHDPVQATVTSQMNARLHEYSQKVQIDVFVGTYNLNGKAPLGESLESWLCFDPDCPEPDLYVIGFQEIVKLTPKQIMATDENKRVIWEKEVERTINKPGGARYVQLRSGQLVGAALMIYAKEENLPHIRNVECSIKKTGMKGMAGNKGAVAIRMDYFETSLCLVTSHLASGQENIQERNNDYHTINDGVTFARGRNISSHDIILWCGDFNYRVDMDNDQIRALVAQRDAKNYEIIYRCDQLKRSIDYGEAFYGYKEGIIRFEPTYRYDIGTDSYDTSEKYRAPAWTDRILYMGRGIIQTSYQRAELRTSDHRPVMSIFVVELTMLDAAAKERMEETLYRQNSNRSVASGSLTSHKSPLSEKLAKPSSDIHQWWNDPLEDGHARIPSNNRNPFENDRTIADSQKTRPGQPAVPLPPRGNPMTPSVDLLGDTLSGQCNVPTLSSANTGQDTKAGGTKINGNGAASLLANKRSNAPPIPPVSRRTGVPIKGLPSVAVIHKDANPTLNAVRRPAPPPPQRNGATGASRDDTDDDDDDDDNTDDDSDDDNDDDGSVSKGNNNFGKDETSKVKTITKTDKTKESSADQETLVKPSELKKQHQQPFMMPGADKSSLPPGSRSKDSEFIRPGMPSSSSSVSSLATTASTVSIAAPLSPEAQARATATKNKILLPGLHNEEKKPRRVSVSSVSVASLGLGLGGKPVTTKTVMPATVATAKDEEEKPSPSVSELKKSFATTTSTGATLPAPEPKQKPTVTTPAFESSLSAKIEAKGSASSISINKPAGALNGAKANSGNSASSTVSPVIPMTKPLVFSATGASPATTTNKLAASKGPTSNSGTGSSVKRESASGPVKLPGLGGVSISKEVTNKDAKDGSFGPKATTTSARDEEAVKDIKPASGSVREAIKALKTTGTGEDHKDQGSELTLQTNTTKSTQGAVGATGAVAGIEEEAEEKVDAFAFWKSK